jgi:SAM-dependent methyltransferase
MSEQSHQSDPRVLNRRTLERDHRSLARRLCPGMAVLDVGCGTGAITAGIARMVAPEGLVVGIDRDEPLLALARQQHQGIQNLSFQHGDILALGFEGRFDIVNAARTLQWTSQPEVALAQMKKAARLGGRILVLDYNHQNNSWAPEPPIEFRRFYGAFLGWRAANHWDNLMADRLVDLFQSEKFRDIEVHLDDELAERGNPDFFDTARIWIDVAESLGPRMVADGFLNEAERDAAEVCYREWMANGLEKQTLQLRTVEGVT